MDNEVFLADLSLILSEDNERRNQAERQIQEMIKTEPIPFLERCLSLLVRPELDSVINVVGLMAKEVFRRATIALSSPDEARSYYYIEPELANAFIEACMALFDSPGFQKMAANLMASIVIYVVARDADHPILMSLVEKMEEERFMLCCANAWKDILTHLTVERKVQNAVLERTLTGLESDVPNKVKANIIDLLAVMIPILSDILCTQEDCRKFAAAMLSLTSVEDIKESVYMFWEQLSYSDVVGEVLFLSVPEYIQVSARDAVTSDSQVVECIHRTWQQLADVSQEHSKGGLREYVREACSVWLPILLESSDKDGRHALCSLAVENREVVSALWEFAKEYLNSPDSSVEGMAVYCVSVVFRVVEKEMEECYSEVMTHIIKIVSEKLVAESEQVSATALRILRHAIWEYPELCRYDEMFTSILLQKVVSEGSRYASKTLALVLAQMPVSERLSTICSELIRYKSPPCISCVINVFKFMGPGKLDPLYQLSESLFTITVETAKAIAADPDMRESMDRIVELLNPMVVHSGPDHLEELPDLFLNAYHWVKDFDSGLALVIMSEITKFLYLSGQTQNIVNAYLLPTLNFIMAQLSGVGADMQQAAINALGIIAGLDVKVGEYFGDLVAQLLGIIDDDMANVDCRVDSLRALNSLHASFKVLMQPYFRRIVPMYRSVIANLRGLFEVDSQDAIDAGEYVLTAIRLMMESIAEAAGDGADVDEAMLSLIQMATQTIVITKDLWTEDRGVNIYDFGIALVDILSRMKDLDAESTANFIAETEGLHELLDHIFRNDEAEEDC